MVDVLLDRWPQDDDELWEWVATFWGFEIPRVAVCPGHCAPFDAFSNAFFARDPLAIWKASRGLGGKSTMLGILSATEAVVLGAEVKVLGGSAAQSQRVHDVTKECWYNDLAPKEFLNGDPTTFITRLKGRASITALLASQTSVRGPHPQRLRMDEIDEMGIDILDAALGQPMAARGIESQTVLSSTHQYPDATMTEMLKRAVDKGWPIFHWCYKESMGTKANPGWLTQHQVDRSKDTVSEAMWKVEYDLQEPSFEGRAIDESKVNIAFNKNVGNFVGSLDEEIVVEPPEIDPLTHRIHSDALYVTGVDWAKERDWTIIATFRCDVALPKWKCVAWRRTGRRPWPQMVGFLEDRLDEYPGPCAHDNTGLGDVIHDLISHKVEGVVLTGSVRNGLFSDYIKAIENEEIEYPMIGFAFNEHKYVVLDDLWGKGHPPDTLVAGALAWSLRKKVIRLGLHASPVSVGVRESYWRQ